MDVWWSVCLSDIAIDYLPYCLALITDYWRISGHLSIFCRAWRCAPAFFTLIAESAGVRL